jgi:1-acyl-sn-glycerol-3-phosphate acyltransferase
MKLIWYYFVKLYMYIGFSFYYKSIRLVGKENIPKNKAILFVSNHQNALIDPLLIAVTNSRVTHFLTQAVIFKNPVVKKLLFSVNMIPIYRIRDGRNSISKNDKIFEYCYEIFNKKEAVLIFAEGSHNIQHRIRPLSKGFTRIVFGALEQNTNLEIDIIPVGINYSNAKKYASNVSIYYGKPISVNQYWENYDKTESINSLKNEVSDQMKKLTVHIEDSSKHDEIAKYFREDDFLYPEKVNKKLENISNLVPLEIENENQFNFLNPIVKFNSFFPLQIWKYAYSKVKEEEYISTFRFSVGITAFPIFYLLQSWLVSVFLNPTIGLVYLFLSFLFVYLLTKSK